MTHKHRKKLTNDIFSGCSLLRTEGFSCSVDVLYGGLRPKLQFLIQKFSAVFFSPWIWIGSGSVSDSLEMLDSYPDSMNPDPQLWQILIRNPGYNGKTSGCCHANCGIG